MNLLKNLVGKSDENGVVGKQFQIGPFQVKVEAKLAEGGYASIFRVRDVEKGTPFAMKLIRVQGNPEALEEVKVEARVMQQLRSHPQVLRLHAVTLVGPKGAEDCLMLLDLCEHSLVDAARKRQLDPRACMEAFHDTCKAVAHMHAQQPPLAHRCPLQPPPPLPSPPLPSLLSSLPFSSPSLPSLSSPPLPFFPSLPLPSPPPPLPSLLSSLLPLLLPLPFPPLPSLSSLPLPSPPLPSLSASLQPPPSSPALPPLNSTPVKEHKPLSTPSS